MRLQDKNDKDNILCTSTTMEDKLRNHKLSPTCLCVDSRGEHAYTGSKDGSIIQWSIKLKKILRKVNSCNKLADDKQRKKQHSRHINCIALSSDDKFVATGGWDKLIRLWDARSLDWLHTFVMHRQEITALVFRSGCNTLYSGSADRSVMIWSLEDDDNRCFVEAMYGHESTITSMDARRKETVLTSGGQDNSIRIWKIIEQAQSVYEFNHGSIDIVRYIDDKTFVSGGEDGSICVWSTMKKKPVFKLENAHKPDKNHAIDNTVADQTKLKYWISALATTTCHIQTNKSARTDRPSKRRKISDSHDESLDVDNSNVVDEDDTLHESESDADLAEDAPDASEPLALIASGSCNSEVRVWALAKRHGDYSLQLYKKFDNCPGFVNDLSFTTDARKIVAVCGQEHKFGRWWRLKNAKNCIKVLDM